MSIEHEWKFDFPWEMVNLKDWFYMINKGYIAPAFYLHVRVLGVRSMWVIMYPYSGGLG